MKILSGLLLILGLYACAPAISYSPSTSFSETGSREINDEDILKAFEAEPQLRLPTSIAWYNMGQDSLIFLVQYSDSSTIKNNYLIPKTLIEGRPSVYDYYSWERYSQPLNFNAVRLFAARAKCDLVILASTQFNENRSANEWAFLNVLIIPFLFTPYYDIHYQYVAELFVFDVRNAYMYRHLKFSDNHKEERINIWEVDKLARSINKNMINNAAEFMKKELNVLFSDTSMAAVFGNEASIMLPGKSGNTSKGGHHG